MVPLKLPLKARTPLAEMLATLVDLPSILSNASLIHLSWPACWLDCLWRMVQTHVINHLELIWFHKYRQKDLPAVIVTKKPKFCVLEAGGDPHVGVQDTWGIDILSLKVHPWYFRSQNPRIIIRLSNCAWTCLLPDPEKFNIAIIIHLTCCHLLVVVSNMSRTGNLFSKVRDGWIFGIVPKRGGHFQCKNWFCRF